MTLYESWMKKAFSQEGHSVEAIWEEYLPREQKIYEYILGEKVEKLEGKVSELAERFSMTAEQIVAFVAKQYCCPVSEFLENQIF